MKGDEKEEESEIWMTVCRDDPKGWKNEGKFQKKFKQSFNC